MLKTLDIHGSAGTSADGSQSMLILKEHDGDRLLPVLMSSRRAFFCMMRSQFDLPIPLPISVADIAVQMMATGHMSLKSVELTALNNGLFFCRMHVSDAQGEEHEVDFCQASDGITLAAAARCPVTIDEELLEAQYLRPTGEHSFAMSLNLFSRGMLEQALATAVAEENYEAASKLRDELARRPKEEED